jgi:alpha(1,3/1,4) fucosyltransferase
MNKSISIRFQWFWSDFDPYGNFFVHFLESEGYEVEVIRDKNAKVDVEFVSVFPPFRRKINEKIQRWKSIEKVGFGDVSEKYNLEKFPNSRNYERRIWFTGENLRPPLMENFDAFLSYDLDPYENKNAYLPIWYLEVDFFGRKVSSRTGMHISLNDLTANRKKIKIGNKFGVSFIGNQHPIRMQAIKHFSQDQDIELFGSSVNRPVTEKFGIAKDFKFAFCFENDLYPGYVTEKLIDAYACGNIPLYWGHLGFESIINPASYINLADFKSIKDFRDFVLSLENSDLLAIANQPLLLKKPDFNDILTAITGCKN